MRTVPQHTTMLALNTYSICLFWNVK